MQKNGVDGIQEGIVLMDTTGKIEYVNSVLEKMLGFSVEELKGQPISELSVGYDFEKNWSGIIEKINSGNSFEFPVIKLIKRNGRTTTTRVRGFSLKRPAGDETWVVFYVQDISQEVNTNIELEKRNRELTRENSMLLKESSNFKRISELKTKFLGIASHELKTPLTSIKGYSEILLDTMSDDLSDEVERMISRISRAADKLHNVVNDMLDVTRIEQDKLRLRPEGIDLKELILDSYDDLQQFYTQKNIAFHTEIVENIPTMYGDKTRIQQVFTNLLSNAVKYSPANTAVLASIEVINDTFIITIKDQGVGIDPIEHTNVFSPFYEVTATVNHSSSDTKFLGGGTGLGLSIVLGIVQRHGGTIVIESEGPNNAHGTIGSSFIVTFPVKRSIQWNDDATQMLKYNTIMDKTSVETPDESKRRETPKILIIDDDLEAVELCRVIFNDSYEIISSATGEVGLRVAFRENPDLILVNFYLPGLEGTQICRILKTQEETQNIPVAFFSAATQDNEVEQCFASGGDDFIVKPFSNKEILEKVSILLS